MVVASKLLALAIFETGSWVQSFPTFGAERRGAPVAAFVRIDDKPINLRCSITEPDVVLLLDHTLLTEAYPLAGLKPRGRVVVNSNSAPDLQGDWHCHWVDADRLAIKMGLGSANHPVVNTAMIGAFAGATGLIGMEHIRTAFEGFLGEEAARNIQAAQYAFKGVVGCS